MTQIGPPFLSLPMLTPAVFWHTLGHAKTLAHLDPLKAQDPHSLSTKDAHQITSMHTCSQRYGGCKTITKHNAQTLTT